MSKWRKGPPPSIGWWPASTRKQPKIMRWWDGQHWSFPAHEIDDADTAAHCAKFMSTNQDIIEWTDRPDSWPQRSKT